MHPPAGAILIIDTNPRIAEGAVLAPFRRNVAVYEPANVTDGQLPAGSHQGFAPVFDFPDCIEFAPGA